MKSETLITISPDTLIAVKGMNGIMIEKLAILNATRVQEMTSSSAFPVTESSTSSMKDARDALKSEETASSSKTQNMTEMMVITMWMMAVTVSVFLKQDLLE